MSSCILENDFVTFFHHPLYVLYVYCLSVTYRCHPLFLNVSVILSFTESLSSFLPAYYCHCTHSHSQPLRSGSSLSAADYLSWARQTDTHTDTHANYTHVHRHTLYTGSQCRELYGPKVRAGIP